MQERFALILQGQEPQLHMVMQIAMGADEGEMIDGEEEEEVDESEVDIFNDRLNSDVEEMEE